MEGFGDVVGAEGVVARELSVAPRWEWHCGCHLVSGWLVEVVL